MRDLQGKVVAITGAGSGIGRALALAFARAGALLSLSDIQPDAAAQTADLIPSPPAPPLVTPVDVSDHAQVNAWAAQTAQRFGRVNVIVNNAGVALSGPVQSLSISDYEWIMNVNFWGVVYGTKAFLPLLEASGEGHIVNISSVFGLTSQPLMSGYNASKFAVRGFTESLRQDLELQGSCVSATCVHPGGIRTNIARAARIHDSVAALTGRSPTDAAREFERSFITSPNDAAQAILRAIQANRRRALIGPDARVFDWCARLLPSGYQRLFTALVKLRSARSKP